MSLKYYVLLICYWLKHVTLFFQFLSMKLATVNPRLDFNLEGLLTKDVSDSVPTTNKRQMQIGMFFMSLVILRKNQSSLQILQSRSGPSSTLGYPPDITMPFPSLHPSQPGLIQTGLPGMANSSDVLRRSINTQLTSMSGGYKEPTPQVYFGDLEICFSLTQTCAMLLHVIRYNGSPIEFSPLWIVK